MEFIKMSENSLFYSLLIILKSLQNKPDSLLGSDKPFSTPGDETNFYVSETHRRLLNC